MSIKEKEPTSLACSDQDMSYRIRYQDMSYIIKEKEPALVCSDQDMSYSIKESQHWFAQIRICHTALRRKSQY